MRIAILHDFFEIRGGGERMVMSLARHLDADVYYGFWKQSSYTLDGIKGHSLNAESSILGWRTIKVMRAFERMTNLDDYDVVIYSGNTAPFARARRTKHRNIYLCCTPPRYIYDKRRYYADKQNIVTRALLSQLVRYVQPRYEGIVARMDRVVAISKTVQERITRYLGMNSTIVYPPVDTAAFTWQSAGNYYLSSARLDHLKNVDQIVTAFRRMPDKKLIIASGGIRESAIRAQSAGATNIEVRGWVDDSTMRSLVGNCIATVYIPTDEDFGISPVESMAAGKPVIGVGSAGLLETVVHKETGILLRPDFNSAHLQEAIEWMDTTRAGSMRQACERQAQRFSEDVFLRAFDDLLTTI